MVITILIWIYAAILCLIYGLMFTHLLEKFLNQKIDLPIPLILINGLILITWGLSIWQLFFRIHVVAHLLLIGIAIIFILKYRSDVLAKMLVHILQFKRNWLPVLIFSLQFVFVLILTISPIVHSDTGLYHATTVHWFEKYPIIPGLGNLFHYLAYNNSWFVISALFSMSFLRMQPFYGLNGFFTLLFTDLCLYFLFSKREKSNTLLRIFVSLCIFLPPVIMSYAFPSLSPDLPAFILVWIVLLLFLKKLQQPNPYHLDSYTLLSFFYSIFAITLKVSSLPIILLPLYLLVHLIKKESIFRIMMIISLGVVLIIPWVIRSYYLSGYLIFPFHWVDVFSPDWKVPIEQVVIAEQTIRNWVTDRYQINYQQILNLHIDQWVPFWVSHTSPWKPFGFFAGILFPFVILIMLGTLVFEIMHKGKFLLSWAYFMIVCGCIFWFFSAPTPRYGEGFLMPLLTLPMAHALTFITKNRSEIFRWLLVVPFILILVFYFESLIPINFNMINTKSIVHLAGYPKPELRFQYVNGQKIYYPKDSLCWNAPVPCAENSDFHFEMRGKTILDGFRYAESRN